MNKFCIIMLLCFVWTAVAAHELRSGYLEITELSVDTCDVLWKLPKKLASGDIPLHLQFADDAQCIQGPITGASVSGVMQRMRMQRAKGFAHSSVTVCGLESVDADVLLRYRYQDGQEQMQRLTPAAAVFVIPEQPNTWSVAWTYTVLGAEHILIGIDHLCFVLSLLLLIKGWRRLIATVTAFTIAHSLTLALSALGIIGIPGPPVEAVIALSIVFVAWEILRVQQGHKSMTVQRPWLIALSFGLLHGCGFAGALSEVGIPQHAIPIALLTFNIGVELGQLVFIALILSFTALMRQFPLPHALCLRCTAYGLGVVGSYWMIDRIVGFWA